MAVHPPLSITGEEILESDAGWRDANTRDIRYWEVSGWKRVERGCGREWRVEGYLELYCCLVERKRNEGVKEMEGVERGRRRGDWWREGRSGEKEG